MNPEARPRAARVGLLTSATRRAGGVARVKNDPARKHRADDPLKRYYDLMFYAYCGTAYAIERKLDDRREARTVAARVLRKRRTSGHTVAILEHGTAWDCQTSEDCALIPDTAGVLEIVERHAPGA